MIRLMLAGGISMLVALAVTPLLIRWLTGRRIGQQIRLEGPTMHAIKAGTPTMGGVAIVVAVVVGYVLSHIGPGVAFSPQGWLVIFATVAAAGIGLIDDWISVRRQRSLGLNKRGKLAAQIVVAVVFALAALHWASPHGHLTYLSFTRWDSTGIQLGVAGWIVFAVVVMVGSANAVNLTDGLDGLAAGSATFCFAILAIMGYWQARHWYEYAIGPRPGSSTGLDLAMAATALAGACLGFLWWNAAPARIFMGDTGSLAIGSGLAALCLEMNLQLLLLLLGGLFVIVTLSVMIQVVSFRVFHRRVFRMAPLHHHFELGGWPETTVIVRFWILAGVFAALALGVFYADWASLPPGPGGR